ncbi:MAG: hypothetical protein JWM59_3065 [Verrucomicrobiales bacterium]|nr:hypothetical protein [Verrucomicrobiales bacterium]
MIVKENPQTAGIPILSRAGSRPPLRSGKGPSAGAVSLPSRTRNGGARRASQNFQNTLIALARPASSQVYEDHFVRKRLEEFLGRSLGRNLTAHYITQADNCLYQRGNLRKPTELDWFLQNEMDIARSLGDTESLLFHLDVEYVNFDIPGQAFPDPHRAFELQQPVITTIDTLLYGWGIKPLHILTGQGHHFVWRIPRVSPLAAEIASLSPAPELLEPCTERIPHEICPERDMEGQRAFGAVALLMEFVAHRVRAAAARHSSLPVEMTAVHVGPCHAGQREIISIDISEYGDPLHARMVRMPFTRYRKALAQGASLWAVPVDGMTTAQSLEIRGNGAAVADLAHRASGAIPDQTPGTERLLSAYEASALCCFHKEFYSSKHDPPSIWSQTYDRTPLDFLPHCARHILTCPNDRLLKPAGIQIVTRSLLAQGWHPRHIAGLIRSKFADSSYSWGIDWNDYEPGTRADFYVRLFAGLYATGLDQLVDMNCVSTAEKGFCFQYPGICPGLEKERHNLLSRKYPL